MKTFIEGTKWKVVERVDEVSYEADNLYFYENVPAIKIPLKSRNAKILSGYLLIEKDIRNIIEWINMMIELLNSMTNSKEITKPRLRKPDKLREHRILKSLFVSIVTFYGKIFTQAKGRKIKLEENIFGDNAELLETHKTLMLLRHNFAAHSGEEIVESTYIYLLLDSNKKNRTHPEIARELTQPDSPPQRELRKYLELMEYLREHAVKRIKIFESKLSDDIYSQKIDFWYYIAENET